MENKMISPFPIVRSAAHTAEVQIDFAFFHNSRSHGNRDVFDDMFPDMSYSSVVVFALMFAIAAELCSAKCTKDGKTPSNIHLCSTIQIYPRATLL
jgi:hypothetical protein